MVTYSSADNTRCENSLWKGKLHCPEFFIGEQTELRFCKLGPGMAVLIFEVDFILAQAVSIPVGWHLGGGLVRRYGPLQTTLFFHLVFLFFFSFLVYFSQECSAIMDFADSELCPFSVLKQLYELLMSVMSVCLKPFPFKVSFDWKYIKSSKALIGAFRNTALANISKIKAHIFMKF